MSGEIFIIGSFNACYTFRAKRLPGPGESIMGHTFRPLGSGKGNNQALSANALGGNVHILMRVGDDEYGRWVRERYRERGIDTSFVITDKETPTGSIGIFYGESGENCMVGVPGANGKLSKEDVDNAMPFISRCKVIGGQFEANPETVLYAMKRAQEAGVMTLLDPAPATPLPLEAYKYLSVIKPNEHEAAVLAGFPVETPEDAFKAGRVFLERGVKSAAIITLGGKGCVLVTRDREKFFDAPKVKAVDTGGAGDSFFGSLLYCLANDLCLDDALIRASCNASLVTTRKGSVIEVFPDKDEREALYNSYIKTQNK